MKYDKEQMENDINTYGLYTPEVFEPYGLTEDMFYAVGGQYFKIFVERGELTFEDVIQLIDEFITPDTKVDFVV